MKTKLKVVVVVVVVALTGVELLLLYSQLSFHPRPTTLRL